MDNNKELWRISIENLKTQLKGRPQKYTAVELADKFLEYCEWCSANAIVVANQMRTPDVTDKKGKKSAAIAKVVRPLTISGFTAFAGIGNWSQYKKDHQESEDFRRVINVCEGAIRDQQITGGMVGLYHPNLTARLNGLIDKQDITTGGKSIGNPLVKEAPLTIEQLMANGIDEETARGLCSAPK